MQSLLKYSLRKYEKSSEKLYGKVQKSSAPGLCLNVTRDLRTMGMMWPATNSLSGGHNTISVAMAGWIDCYSL